jgi:hypothetical protein
LVVGVLRVAWRSVRGRQTATKMTALAVALTVVGFTVLGATATSKAVELRGAVDRAWQTPYDVLVRPSTSVTPLEARRGLVRPNYVTGIDGGITMKQLRIIRAIPGVDVAAPIAVVGFVEWPTAIEVRTPPSRASVQIYRFRATERADARLSQYPIETRFIVVAPQGRLTLGLTADILTIGKRTIECRYPVNCFAGVVCDFSGHCARGAFPSSSSARYYLPLLEPVVVAGIDPVAEQRLVGLKRCLRHGTYLDRHASPVDLRADPADLGVERIPVLVSDRSFLT